MNHQLQINRKQLTMRTTNIGTKFQEVKSLVDLSEVATRLGARLTKQSGSNTYQGTCPIGHASSSGKSFHVDMSKELFHCFNCDIGGDTISLVEKVKGLSKWDSLKWLVKEFNVKVDLGQPQLSPKHTPEEITERNEMISRSMVFEKIYEIGKKLLYEVEGTEALKYLTDVRGYDVEILKNTEWICQPEEYDIKVQLIKENPEMKEAVGVLKLQGYYGDSFRLAFPYRDKGGMITGFLKRAAVSSGITVTTYDGKEHEGVRWDSTPKLKKVDLFGLDKVDAKEDTLIIVEGYPDAIYLQALGIKNIVAVGQGLLSEKHLIGMISRKIKNVIISFDNDGVGSVNSEKAVKLVLKNTNITPYVIDPSDYSSHKDPDEYFKANGFDSLKKIFDEKPQHGVGFVVSVWTHDIQSKSVLAKKKIKEDIMELLSFVNDESVVTEILGSIKKTFNENAQSLKRQLKAGWKTYSDEIEKHIAKDPILPLLDKNSNTRGYYIAEDDILNLGIEKEFIEELMLDAGLNPPKKFPAFTVKFNPQDLGSKFNLREKTFNLFTPTKYMFLKKNNEVIDLETSCPAIYTILSNVVPVRTEREKYFNWLSYTFSTRQKSIVAWLFRGAQGTGKNIMFEKILTPLWGDKHCSVVGNSALDSQFNPHMKHKMMIAYNEVTTDNKRDKMDKESRIKSYVSDATVNINEKNIREYKLDNHSSSMFFSNYIVPIIIEDGDRRFNVAESNSKLEHNPYFMKFTYDKFKEEIASELETFAQYLLNYNHNSTTANRTFMNDAKRRIVGSSMNMFEVFSKKLLEKDYEWLRDESGVWLENSWDLETIMDGYIVKEEAAKVFNKLYGVNFAPQSLSLKLQHYGITITKKKAIGGIRIPIYSW